MNSLNRKQRRRLSKLDLNGYTQIDVNPENDYLKTFCIILLEKNLYLQYVKKRGSRLFIKTTSDISKARQFKCQIDDIDEKTATQLLWELTKVRTQYKNAEVKFSALLNDAEFNDYLNDLHS